jgi:hypothetical protein
MMKRSLAIVTLVILALAVPASMLAQQSKAEKEVRATLDQLTQANVKGGAEAASMLEKLLADDFTLVIGSGKVFTKAEVVNAWRTGQYHYSSYDLSDVKIRIYGNTAVATGVLTQTSEGTLTSQQNVQAQTRFARIFVKRSGNWQSVLYQQTRISQPASAQTSSNAPPSYVANPANYKVIGENDLFRVILEKKPVGVRDPWHSHLDSAVYNLSDCHQRIYRSDGTTREVTLETGSVVWQSAMTHSTENIGASECEMLLVERK